MNIRHGDVLLRPRKSANPVAMVIPPEDDRVVLAYGERSGHIHALPYGGAMLYRDSMGAAVLSLDAPKSLEHLVGGEPTGEHAALDVPAGDHEVIQQSEIGPGMAPTPHAD